jgi:hypothetical protein
MRSAMVLLVLALTASVVSAQEAAWAQKILFGVTSHDFGTCPRGAQLKHRLRMKNIYAVPLQITDIRSSCGCLSFQASTKTLQPQEEGYIDLTMDARRFTGPKTLNLYVTVGPQYISTATVVIMANARTDVVFNPGEINFGIVPAGSTPTQTIDVEYAGSQDWYILEVVKSKSAPITVVPQEMYRNKPRVFQTGKVGYQLAVTLNPDAPPGPFHQKILLKTNDPASPVLTVNVEGHVQAALTASPGIVNFATVRVHQKTTQRVIVRGLQPFVITAVKGTGQGIQVDYPPQRAAIHYVNVHCDPEQAGALNRELQFITDTGNAVSVTVQATATN